MTYQRSAGATLIDVWAVKGRIVALASDRNVAPSEDSVFAGRVWIGDDDRIVAVTKGTSAGPPGSAGATVIDVGSSLVIPGLVDLHNHLAYNTLPLWTEPSQITPFAHHNSWTRADTYALRTTWPAYALITACPQELLAYVEAKAVVGGTTSIQGSPPKNRPRDGWLVRNIEDETFGEGNANLVYASVLTAKPSALAERANKMRKGSAFIYHCAEGQPGSIVQLASSPMPRRPAACSRGSSRCTPTPPIPPASPAGTTKARSPGHRSPISGSTGRTTDVPAARAPGITVCLGSDWAPSGTKHVLGELKAAQLTAASLGWDLSDVGSGQDGHLPPRRRAAAGLAAPGRPAAARSPGRSGGDPVQAPRVGLCADRRGDRGRHRSGGDRRSAALRDAGADGRHPGHHRPAGQRPGHEAGPEPAERPEPGLAVDEVVERMEEVRANPKREVEAANAMYARWAGKLDDAEAPLRLALDMPTGLAPVGGLPKDLGQIDIPPLESLTHDGAWLDSLPNRGFHGGVLDDLATYYSH